MAIVRRLDHQTLERESPHREVECIYSIITDDQRRRWLQVDTCGPADRQFPGKKSQSIRFAPEAIAQLKSLLSEEL
jgi:hypothetical protein